jgi:ABC-type siderophore export system fused ATPase/permease subunit
MGDVLSAAVVFVGTAVLSLSPRTFALVNAVIVVGWLILAWRVGRQYQSLTIARQPHAAAS